MAQASLIPRVSLFTLIGGGISLGLSLQHCYLMTVGVSGITGLIQVLDHFQLPEACQ